MSDHDTDAYSAEWLLRENAGLRAELLRRAEIDAEDTHRLQSVCTALYAEVARLRSAAAALESQLGQAHERIAVLEAALRHAAGMKSIKGARVIAADTLGVAVFEL